MDGSHLVEYQKSLLSVFPLQHHIFMPSKLNSPGLLFSDYGMRFCDQVLRFLNGCLQKPSFGHCGDTQSLAHVRLF
jgi:hypothetical protein